MEKFRPKNITDLVTRIGQNARSAFEKHRREVELDRQWSEERPFLFQLPSDLDLEKDKEKITHAQACLTENTLTGLRDTTEFGISGGYSPQPHFRRDIHLECLFCHERGANLLNGHPLREKVISFVNTQHILARGDWLDRKMKGDL